MEHTKRTELACELIQSDDDFATALKIIVKDAFQRFNCEFPISISDRCIDYASVRIGFAYIPEKMSYVAEVRAKDWNGITRADEPTE